MSPPQALFRAESLLAKAMLYVIVDFVGVRPITPREGASAISSNSPCLSLGAPFVIPFHAFDNGCTLYNVQGSFSATPTQSSCLRVPAPWGACLDASRTPAVWQA
jgi:hypothetical protein